MSCCFTNQHCCSQCPEPKNRNQTQTKIRRSSRGMTKRCLWYSFAFGIHVNSSGAAAHEYLFIVGRFIDVQHMPGPGNQVRYCCNMQHIDNNAAPRRSLPCQIAQVLTAALPLAHRCRGFNSSALVESNPLFDLSEK